VRFVDVTKRESRSDANNPNGIVASSPRLVRQRLPWVYVSKWKQPQRGCGRLGSVDGGEQNKMAATALRLGIYCGCWPRVARASQPWAGGRNPLGFSDGHYIHELHLKDRLE